MTAILLLGFGSIGRDLVDHLAPDLDSGALSIVGAVVRDPDAHVDLDAGGIRILDRTEVTEALPSVDLIVECAGVDAVLEHASWLATRPLVLTSVGALAYDAAAETLLRSPELIVTNGAIGGFDLLEAAAAGGGLDAVRIRTHKLPGGLIQPWMSAPEQTELETLAPGDAPLEVFVGTPRDAIARFPANVNVAVALAWATRGTPPSAPAAQQLHGLRTALDAVVVHLLADADAELSRHVISASGAAGDFEFDLESAPSAANPATSGMTARSVARDVRLVADRMRRAVSPKGD